MILPVNLARAKALIALLRADDPDAAHLRSVAGTSLLSYAERLDDRPDDAVLARTVAMLEAEVRGDAPLGTWAEFEAGAVWDHVWGPTGYVTLERKPAIANPSRVW